MKVKQLTLEQMRRIYDDFFPEAFPQNEIRPWENLKGHWDNGRYECYGYFDDEDTLCSYAFFFRSERALLLDYLASVPQKRSGGLGASFLKELCKNVVQDMMLAEVEAPISGDPETDALRCRRIAFYERNGLVQKNLMSCVYDATYRFMSTGFSGTDDEFHALVEQMYLELLGQTVFQEHVIVWQEPVKSHA